MGSTMPLRMEQYERSLAQPPLCEQLKVRDLCNNLLIQISGSFVAGYRMGGICSYYASDDDRNRTKLLLEALIRSLPERSMRLQARFEISEGVGDLLRGDGHAAHHRDSREPGVDRRERQADRRRAVGGSGGRSPGDGRSEGDDPQIAKLASW